MAAGKRWLATVSPAEISLFRRLPRNAGFYPYSSGGAREAQTRILARADDSEAVIVALTITGSRNDPSAPCLSGAYYLKSARGVLVVHAFMKKDRATSRHDIEVGRKRLREIVNEEI
jgi:hypothetical protein